MNKDLENILKQLQINAATKTQHSESTTMHSQGHTNSSKSGLQKGWTRTTFIIKEEHVQKLKEIAYWERITLKKLIEEALTTFLDTKSLQTATPKKNF
ncbi:MAG: hypothetical protein P4L31_08555 [Candidatus Babeliales bacterium]|nr:hypothetical protein [Candidatus Babeliales bacterium]